MRRAIIHIGMHKTGTTAIQQAFAGFRHDRIAMSCLAPAEQNYPLTVLFAKDPQDSQLARRGGVTADNLASIRAEFSRLLEQDLRAVECSILWSAEMLSAPDQAQGMAERMIARLRPHFDRIEVIAYVRAPGPFLAAALQERLRWGRAPTGWDQMWAAYPRRFARWEELADTIRYRHYQPAAFPQGDVVLDFCREIGVPPRAGTALNVSDGLHQVALQYVQRRFGQDLIADPAHMPALAHLRRQIAHLPHVPFRIAPARLHELLETYADDCAWMAARLPGLDLTEGLAPREGIAEIADPADLCAVAAQLEDQIRALAPAEPPDDADPMTRIAAMLTDMALNLHEDQGPLQARIADLARGPGPEPAPVQMLANALDLAFYSDQAHADFSDTRAAAQHYLDIGWQSGLDPAPWFSHADYIRENPDVQAAAFAPFYHFILHGAAEGRPVRPSRVRPAAKGKGRDDR